MKEVFSHRDFVMVSSYAQLLEAEGFLVHVKNERLTMLGLADIPIPNFYPALCVVNDGDYEAAVDFLRKRISEEQEGASGGHFCKGCEEVSPGNFEICWNCGEDLFL